MEFVFLEVEAPSRLVWQHADHGKRPAGGGAPTCRTSLTLEDLGERTRWTMEARFASFPDPDAALSIGFTRPFQASSDGLVRHLEAMESA